MKLKNVFSAIVMLMVILLSSCDNNQDSNRSVPASGVSAQDLLTATLSSKISAESKSSTISETTNSIERVNLGVTGDL